jgi:hypothetical protein
VHTEGIVLCVYESAFDVLIPEYGFEKRVHCDQLPLKLVDAEYNALTDEITANLATFAVHFAAGLNVHTLLLDVLIPEYGFEKRVHCDQLPLKKAEYRKDSRVLEPHHALWPALWRLQPRGQPQQLEQRGSYRALDARPRVLFSMTMKMWMMSPKW